MPSSAPVFAGMRPRLRGASQAPLRLMPVVIAGTVMATVFSAPAIAFMPDDQARQAVVQLRNEMEARFQTLEAGSRGQLGLANEMEQLRAEIARLRGQVEMLTHDLEGAQKRQRDFYGDLDNRLKRLEPSATSLGAAPAVSEAASSATPDTATESREFEAGLTLVKAGKHAEAFAALERFTRTRPQSSLLPGAHFWAGSSALQARNIDAALRHFTVVIERFPQDSRTPDALLGLANAQQALNDARAARRTLETLVERHPGSEAAQVARQRLGSR